MAKEKSYKQVPRRIRISGSSGWRANLLEVIEKRLSDGWRRDRQLERGASDGSYLTYYCFCCPAQDQRPAAALFLVWPGTDQNTLDFANVLSLQGEQLSFDECNVVTVDFYLQFVRPCCDELGLDCELTDAYASR